MAWDPLTEGDAFTGDSLWGRLSGVQNRINDLPSTSVEKQSFTNDHLPSVVSSIGHAVIDTNTDHTYNSVQEPYPGWNTVAGWRVINTNGSLGTGTKLEAALSDTVDISLDSNKVLILGNVHLVNIQELTGTGNSTDYYAVFAFQVQTDDAVWHHIARSERYANAETFGGTDQLVLWKDIPIRCLLTTDDLLSRIIAVRMVISVCNAQALFALEVEEVSLQHGNLSVLAYRSGNL